jgi:XTP/dITP diphosphohydrolase
MQKVILATKNQGKVKEFADLLAPLHLQVISSHDLDPEKVPNIVEDGETFEQNALKKAKAYYKCFGVPALADDSGLEVDALEGKPGIYSARYAGEGKGDQANNEKLLAELKGTPAEERTARFICAIAYVDGKSSPIIVRGSCEGSIVEEPKGEGGFGYDPLFLLSGQDRTMAQLTKEEKNKCSHRYHALQALVQQIRLKSIDE